MKSVDSPEMAVFKDQSLKKPVSATDDVGYAIFGGTLTLVAKIAVNATVLWVPPVMIPSATRLLERLGSA